MKSHELTTRVLKPLVFLVCLAPAVWLVVGVLNGNLGANPVETLTHETGEWGLRLLLVTLLVTPLRRLTGWHALIRLRRMLGLFAFFYVMVHFTIFVWLDHVFDLPAIVEDIAERPYITAGFTAWLLLVPLAVTSTNAMVKRLGAKRWQRLHRAVYFAAIAAVVHFLWLVKADLREPLVYMAILVLLLVLRLPPVARWLSAKRKGAAAGPALGARR